MALNQLRAATRVWSWHATDCLVKESLPASVVASDVLTAQLTVLCYACVSKGLQEHEQESAGPFVPTLQAKVNVETGLRVGTSAADLFVGLLLDNVNRNYLVWLAGRLLNSLQPRFLLRLGRRTSKPAHTETELSFTQPFTETPAIAKQAEPCS